MDDYRKIINSAKIALDRAKMEANPDAPGPRLPEVTPTEEEYFSKLAEGMGSTVGNIKTYASAAEADDLINNLSNMVKQPFIDDVKRTQQIANRAMDFEARNKQAQINKFQQIRKLLGR